MTERSERLRAAIKTKDGWFARNFSAKLANRFVSLVGDTSITPNQVTLFALLVALVASYLMFTMEPIPLIVGSILLQIAFILDCADGQLARFRGVGSAIGGWLDQVADRIREFFLVLALIWGYYLVTDDVTIWPLGFAAFFLLFMLEYYSQMNCQIPDPVKDESESDLGSEEDFDAFEGAIDRIMPLAGFRMGEQLFFFTLFGIIAGATGDPVWIKYLIIFVVLLGGAHLLYRPYRRLKAYYSSLPKDRAA